MTANDDLEHRLADAAHGTPRDIVAKVLYDDTRRAVFGVESEPHQVGRFRIVRQLGSGGMGVVFVAHDPKLDRQVALKLIRVDSDHERQRIMNEARTLARLQHDNIVTVYEVEVDGDDVYLAMELIDGDSLEIRAKGDWRSVARTFAAAASGLDAAHQSKVVHGDVKPANIMVSRAGRVCLVDFGLSNLDGAGDSRGPAGTPGYLSPEQRAGEPASEASDLYAWFVSLRQCLDGVSAPLALKRFAQRGTADDPKVRPSSMTEVRRFLDRLLGRRRRRVLAAAGVGLAVVAAGAGFYASRTGTPAGCEPLAHDGWPVARDRWHERARAAAIPDDIVASIGGIVDRRAERWLASQSRHCNSDDSEAVDPDLWSTCRQSLQRVESEYLETLLTGRWESYENTPLAFDSLLAVEFCDTPAGLRSSIGDDAVASPAANDVRRMLARVSFLADTSATSPPWRELLDQAAAKSETLANRALAADVAQVKATFVRADTYQGQDAQWREVVAMAEVSGNRFAVAKAWLALSNIWINAEPTDRRVDHALEQADWAIKRLDDPPILRFEWHEISGHLAGKKGDYESAAAHFDKAIAAAAGRPTLRHRLTTTRAKQAHVSGDLARARALYEQALADSTMKLAPPASKAQLYLMLAQALMGLRELDAGLDAIGKAIKLTRVEVAADNPRLGIYLQVRARLELAKGDTAAAIGTINEALALLEPAYGANHSLVAAAYTTRADAEELAGDFASAIKSSTKARDIYVELHGRKAVTTIMAATDVARNYVSNNQYAVGRKLYEEALAEARAALGDTNKHTTAITLNLAALLGHLGEHRKAAAMAESAVTNTIANELAPERLGDVQFVAAGILAKSNRTRALELATQAVANLGDYPEFADKKHRAVELVAQLEKDKR